MINHDHVMLVVTSFDAEHHRNQSTDIDGHGYPHTLVAGCAAVRGDLIHFKLATERMEQGRFERAPITNDEESV